MTELPHPTVESVIRHLEQAQPPSDMLEKYLYGVMINLYEQREAHKNINADGFIMAKYNTVQDVFKIDKDEFRKFANCAYLAIKSSKYTGAIIVPHPVSITDQRLALVRQKELIAQIGSHAMARDIMGDLGKVV